MKEAMPYGQGWGEEYLVPKYVHKTDYKPLFQFWQKYNADARGWPIVLGRLFGDQNLGFDFGQRKIQGFLAPKFDLIFNPAKALEEHQFYSLIGMIINPFTAAATGISIAGQNLKEKHEETGEKKYQVANGFLWAARGTVGGLALLVHAIETLITYAIIATLAIATSPFWGPVAIGKRVKNAYDAKHAEDGLVHHNNDYHQYEEENQGFGGNYVGNTFVGGIHQQFGEQFPEGNDPYNENQMEL